MYLSLFTQRIFVANYSTEIDFIPKTEKSVFEPAFGGLRGNVRIYRSLERPWSTSY